ncbi:MAG: hypothetical protein PUG48_01345 [Clostridia bacterium]|nr:hypothetical protein [Clostridia bacterium]
MSEQMDLNESVTDKKPEKKSKKKKLFIIFSIIIAVILIISLSFNSILNFFVNKTMGKDLPQLIGEPKVGEWYAVDIEDAVSSDGSKWQGYFRKGEREQSRPIFLWRQF